MPSSEMDETFQGGIEESQFPESLYGQSKRLAEKMVLKANGVNGRLATAVIVPHAVFGYCDKIGLQMMIGDYYLSSLFL